MTHAKSSSPLYHPSYPRSNTYDPKWVFANQMGPNALWLLEALCEAMRIEPGMRVLDLGCGTAMTSIFLAKEFGAEVWATDLWIDASSNQERIRDAGVERVFPIHAEAHQLPFASEFFDAIVSVDAYHYFGTADLYLGYLTGFLRPGGKLGIVVPAVLTEFGLNVPNELAPFWDGEFCSFHGPEWWRAHWEKTGKVRVERADAIEEGWKDWLRFEEVMERLLKGGPKEAAARLEAATRSIAMLRVDQGNHLGFSRVVATRR
jgi:SAM-dependent methyltransferase